MNESRRWREGRHFEDDAESAPPRAVRIEIIYYSLDARVGREEP